MKMIQEKQLEKYLKSNCFGEDNAIFSKELEKYFIQTEMLSEKKLTACDNKAFLFAVLQTGIIMHLPKLML